jgi:hypothetical protein
MNFLAPLFLLGATAVALPVIFHLIRRTTRQKTVFSSLMFLVPTPPRLTRKSRLEHLLLLALRCLVLCLLALAFARPFFKQPVSDDQSSAGRRVLILVDRSASMRRAGLWSAAQARVKDALARTTPADRVAISTFDRTVTPLFSFEEWSAAAPGERVALASRRLADTSPGWGDTRLAAALIAGAEALTDTSGPQTAGHRQIILVTDLQEGSHLNPLEGYDWPKGVEVLVEPVQPSSGNNAGVELAAESEEASRQVVPTVRVRVMNTADSKREQFQVGWAQAGGPDFLGAPQTVYVPAGQSRMVTLAVPTNKCDQIRLRGDDEGFDNTAFLVVPETPRTSVLYFGKDPEKDARQPRFFLQRALQETRRQAVRLVPCAPGQPIPADELKAAPLLVVADPLPDDQSRALRQQVLAGKTLLMALRDPAAGPCLGTLLDVSDLVLAEAASGSYCLLTEIDFRHPLFLAFADPRFSDFTKIHFWKHRRLSGTAIPGARTLAHFDNGDPALVEVPVGRGRILVLTAGWQPSDSQFALSTKFVPWIYSLLDFAGAATSAPAQYHVGDVVPLPATTGTETKMTIRLPDGSQEAVPAGQTNFAKTISPGVYQVTSGDVAKPFAVNLDASESLTAPFAVDELERLGVPMARPVASAQRETERKVNLHNAELENRQKLWRWALAGTILILLVETWLAGRTLRQAALPTEAAP